MPEEIGEFTVEPRSARRTPKEGISWWMLENEKVWAFTRGIDFTKVGSLKSAAYAAAKRRDMTAHISVIDPEHVEIRFSRGRHERRRRVGADTSGDKWRAQQRKALGLDPE